MSSLLETLLRRDVFVAIVALSAVVSLGVVALGAAAWLQAESLRRAAPRRPPKLRPVWVEFAPAWVVIVLVLPCVVPGFWALSQTRANAFADYAVTSNYAANLSSWGGAAVLVLALGVIVVVMFLSGAARLHNARRARRVEVGMAAQQREVARAWLMHPGPRIDFVAVTVVLVALGAFVFARGLETYAAAIDAGGPAHEWARKVAAGRAGLADALRLATLGFGVSGVSLFLALGLPGLQRFRVEPSAIDARSLGGDSKSSVKGGGNSGATFGSMLAAGLGVAACVLLWRLSAPLSSANASPLPAQHVFTPERSRLALKLLDELGPDELREGPRLVLGTPQTTLDGMGVEGPTELQAALKDKRHLWAQIKPGQPFPARVVFDVRAELTPAVLAEWLGAALRAGYREADFVLVRTTELDRPVLGKLWGWQTSAFQVQLARTPDECDSDAKVDAKVLGSLVPSEVMRGSELLREWLQLRRHGRTACVVLDAARCKEEEEGKRCMQRLSAPSRLVRAERFDEDVTLLELSVREKTFHVLRVADAGRIELWQRGRSGRRLGTFAALAEEFEQGEHALLFALNGGMFEPDFSPVGLLISHGLQLNAVNTDDGEGNFYLKPNGVFLVARERSLTPDGFILMKEPHAEVLPTEELDLLTTRSVLHATQSGPLLLDDGVAHPKLDPESTSTATRNAIGVGPDGAVFMLVSRDRVSLYALVEVFTLLGVDDALYLDGNLSTLYFPEAGFERYAGNFGPMIAVRR